MDGHRDRRAVDREPRGVAPQGARHSFGRRVRRMTAWLFRGREDIDQEGLLAGRTLRASPRRPGREGPDRADGAPPGDGGPPA
jgi:hypothetical protein